MAGKRGQPLGGPRLPAFPYGKEFVLFMIFLNLLLISFVIRQKGIAVLKEKCRICLVCDVHVVLV